jgi:hypothetical protein
MPSLGAVSIGCHSLISSPDPQHDTRQITTPRLRKFKQLVSFIHFLQRIILPRMAEEADYDPRQFQ